MSTRRHQKSEERRAQIIARSVASCMAEFQEHAHEVCHFLVVSSVQPELARKRDAKDASLNVFRASQDRIDSLIRGSQWQELREFVAGLPEQNDIIIAENRSVVEASLGKLWQQFSGFGVVVASSVAWIAEPRIYYLSLWRD